MSQLSSASVKDLLPEEDWKHSTLNAQLHLNNYIVFEGHKFLFFKCLTTLLVTTTPFIYQIKIDTWPLRHYLISIIIIYTTINAEPSDLW